ncbi:centrosomal protein of 290 kDa-like [Syngnathus scovelli]|uniref:centrosomal protein of 290 kDa-like n=1 Tax=Syngnathus scovelli TaxID=161590 RepID=UPI00210F92D4|nr:centrosomal protein of 290 kDa-like [Syngnathus scovelli]XP_049578661.1 centrosomal protein of 290 kDa-like [Syngnathus scovelli]
MEWNDVKKLDPATLHECYKDELDSVIDLLTSPKKWEVEHQAQEDVVHILRVFQSLLKMKHQEATLAEQLVEEQEKNENTLIAKVSRLEEELTYAGSGPENRFLRNEMRELKAQLVRKEEMVNQLKKEVNKEKKTTEKLLLRAEAAEDDVKMLRRENTQLRQDVDFYHGELELKELDMSKEDKAETQRKLTRQLSQCLDDLQQTEDEISRLKADNLRMQECVLELTKEMEKMSDEYNQIKMAVHQCDSETDQLRKERDRAEQQVREVTQKMTEMTEEDDPIMAEVDAKVDEWKKVLSEKDEEILVYQQIIRDLQQKLRLAQLDMDRNDNLALEQAVEERDRQIESLREQVEQYTEEMQTQTLLMESLKMPKKGREGVFLDAQELVQQRKLEELASKWDAAEMRAAEAEEALKRAEAHAEEKDRELMEVSKRLKDFERGIYGLEEAIGEIKECKIQIRRRESELEAVTKENNQAYITIERLSEENEDFRERLGYQPSQEVDLSEFRRAKGIERWQYKAENQVLTKEIERLEEERLEMKKQVRQLAKQKGLPLSMSEEDIVIRRVKWPPTPSQNSRPQNPSRISLPPIPAETTSPPTPDRNGKARSHEEPRVKVELGEEVVTISKREAELNKSQFQFKLEQLSGEKGDVEAALKDVLRALKAKDSTNIPSLKRLANHNLKVYATEMVASLQEEHAKILQEKMKAEQESLRTRRKVDSQEQRLRELAETCRCLEEKLKEKSSHETDGQAALKLAHKSVKDLQSRLNNKEDVIKKYQNQLTQVGKDQEELIKAHAEEMKMLYQKLDVTNNMALDRFKRQAAEAMKNPSIGTSTAKHLDRVGELEQMVAEQDVLLASVSRKLKMATAESERHRAATETQAKKHADEISRLKRSHAAELEDVIFETKDQTSQIASLKKEIDSLQNELETQKEANVKSPSNILKNTAERLKLQLVHKEKQIKALSRVLIGMRTQMTTAAEQQVLANTAQTQEKLNIQKLLDKHTKDLKDRVQELSEHLEAANDSCRKNDNKLRAQVENLNKRLQKGLIAQKALRTQLEEKEQELQELEKQLKTRVDPAQSKEKVLQWEEAKKWRARLDKVKQLLKDKEHENLFLSRQLTSIKDLYAKLEQEKNITQKKTKASGVTPDQIVEKETQLSSTNLGALGSSRLHQAAKKDALTPWQSDADFQKENLKLASENLELRLQLAQANIDLPRFKRKVGELEEMYSVLKNDNAERLCHTREADTFISGDNVGPETDLNKEIKELRKDKMELDQKPDIDLNKEISDREAKSQAGS